MAAVVLNNFKYRLLENELVSFASDSDRYYAVIGRSDPWNGTDTPPDPVNSLREERDFRLSSVSLKEIIDCSLVAPRINWTPGTTYEVYTDDTSDNASKYHVITEENNVYLCLRAPYSGDTKLNSTVQPNSTATYPVLYGDGYVWKFLYNVGTLQSNRFLTASYIPVRYVDSADANSPAADIKQKEIQNAAIPGQIAGFEIISAGSNYTTSPAPTITITGDGTGAQAEAIIAGGSIVSVQIKQNPGNLTEFYHGTGYNYASATVSHPAGTGAVIRPILAPRGGFGADARKDLRADAIMYNVLFSGNEGGEFLVNQDFRQIGLLVNPKHTVEAYNAYGLVDSDFTASASSLLRTLYTQTNVIINGFTKDSKIKGLTSNTIAIIDDLSDTSGNTNGSAYAGYIKYHQTEETGFLSFAQNEEVVMLDENDIETEISTTTIDNVGFDSASLVNPMSGDLLYIDNRAFTQRETAQDEDLKIIIRL